MVWESVKDGHPFRTVYSDFDKDFQRFVVDFLTS